MSEPEEKPVEQIEEDVEAEDEEEQKDDPRQQNKQDKSAVEENEPAEPEAIQSEEEDVQEEREEIAKQSINDEPAQEKGYQKPEEVKESKTEDNKQGNSRENKEETVEKQKEIALPQIVHEKSEQQREEKSERKGSSISESPQQRRSSVAPVIVNPVYHYKGPQRYNWRLEEIDAAELIQKLQTKVLPELYELQIPEEMSFSISGTANIKGHVFYTVQIKDAKGSREIARRYTEFMAMRAKLTELWPCILIAALPSKTLIGISEEDLISNRVKYIIRFLRSISRHEDIYNSDEAQFLLNEIEQGSIESHYAQVEVPKYLQLFQKYKKVFSDDYIYSQRQEFVYRKQKIPLLLEEYENYYGFRKMDLMDSLTSIRRLSDSKQNYFKALNHLNQTLLPEYEDTIYRWIYGESLPPPPPSIMERMSAKVSKQPQSEEVEGRKGEGENKREGEVEVKESQQVKQRKQSQQFKQTQSFKFGLYSSESYKSKFQDASMQMHDFNSSTSQIYDAIKFELKEIDTVISAVEQTKGIHIQMQYLERTITINKEQIESLNNNKTTLKTFFMEGSADDKKTKLSNDNHVLEEQLQKLTEFYYLIMILFERQLEEFHCVRAKFYSQTMSKAFTDELRITRSIMDFHVFEEQLFRKDREQRIKLLRSHEGQEGQEGREEIRE